MNEVIIWIIAKTLYHPSMHASQESATNKAHHSPNKACHAMTENGSRNTRSLMAREKIAQFNYELVLKEMREEDPEFVEDGGGRRPRPPPGGMVWYPQ